VQETAGRANLVGVVSRHQLEPPASALSHVLEETVGKLKMEGREGAVRSTRRGEERREEGYWMRLTDKKKDMNGKKDNGLPRSFELRQCRWRA